MQTLTMPKMGITMNSATIVSWKKKVGDSPFAGLLRKLLLKKAAVPM